jgi:hypothetical protein
VTAAITHRGFLDQVGPLAFPGAPPTGPAPPRTPPPPVLKIAIKSRHLTASKKGVVSVGLKPFNQAATGVVTLREGGRQIGRASYKARTGAAQGRARELLVPGHGGPAGSRSAQPGAKAATADPAAARPR